MSDILNYGVIGCGMMGQEHLRNIALLPGARVAAIFEPDEIQAAAAGALAPEAVMYGSLWDLLGDTRLDCLLVASPNHLHVSQFEEIAARNPLPLLMEKPLFTDPDDAPRLRAMAEGYAAPIWVAMEYRYMPPVQTLLDQVAQATGGVKMLTIQEHRFPFLDKVGFWNRFNRYTGGTLVEKCCHFFDLMRLILRDEPVRVMASAGQEVNHMAESYEAGTPDIWDSAYVICDFAGGARAMLELCMYAEGSRFQEEISAIGPAGKIETRIPGPGRFWPPHLGAPPVSEVVVSPRNPRGPQSIEIPVDPQLLAAGDHNGSTYYQHVRFADAARGKGPVEVSLTDGLRAVEMGLAAQAAALEGRVVTL
ncbi:Predicted dehydrogenase [Tranquillimonas rosea]|uniref:Predicted dehydrogenase n=1 Tax=Tranquillimonas rosea TaxID=641238 RepID=A0A1H9Q6M7_9RHOB|nr:Gfo/Idh/MocA family oxidoreductase [Tranquillimonas rosea]SER56082.1 Predicted dehydrogenase [Tranquillimonas rosea]